jgi:hypothetical protein
MFESPNRQKKVLTVQSVQSVQPTCHDCTLSWKVMWNDAKLALTW